MSKRKAADAKKEDVKKENTKPPNNSNKKILDRRNLIYYIIFGICLIALITFYFCAEPISMDDKGPSYDLEQFVKALVVTLICFLFSRFLTLILLRPLEKKRGRPFPRVVHHLVLIGIFALGACYVLIVIYGKDIGWILTSALAGSALVAHAEENFIKDSFAGVEMDFKNFFEPGDWIECNGKTVKVIDRGLLQTEVEDANGLRMMINNSSLSGGGLINYNRPSSDYWMKINITLGQDVPIERAVRLLQSAAMSAEGVFEQNVKVFAQEFTEGNIIYMVKFKVKNCETGLTTQHNVITAVLNRIHEHGISVADSGECKVIRIPPPPPQQEITSALDIVKMVTLFQHCSEEEQEEIAQKLTLHLFKPNDIIIEEKTFGATMYFIAEGAVEVSLATNSEDPEQNRCHICYIANHSFFGENGVLYDSPRNARVSAFSEVVLYRLTKDSLIEIVKKRPEILEKMTEVIVQRTQEREDKFDQAKQSLEEKNKKKSEFLSAFKKFLGLN